MRFKLWDLFGGREFEIPDSAPTWTHTATIMTEPVNVSYRYSIVTDDKPILRMEGVNDKGQVLSVHLYNLVALDRIIGELITQRDILAKLTKKDE